MREIAALTDAPEAGSASYRERPFDGLPGALITVVIPTYNRKAALLDGIKSVLEQTVEPFEIIVVDDGSTDGTSRINFAKIDPRIRVIRHRHNLGGSAARNTGIDAARGSWVALLDSDDRWLPNKLELQLKAIAGNESKDKLLVCGNVYTDLLKTKVHNTRGPQYNEDIARYLMIENGALQTSTLLLPAVLARSVRFRPGLPRHQDWDFVLRLANRGAKIVYLDEPLAIYNLCADPQRISRQQKAFAATIEWFKVARDLVSPEFMQTYFVTSASGKNMLRHPRTALISLLWVVSIRPRGAISMLRSFGVRRRIHSWLSG